MVSMGYFHIVRHARRKGEIHILRIDTVSEEVRGSPKAFLAMLAFVRGSALGNI